MPDYQIGHLNGCTVAILADGVVQPQQVVTAGIVSLTENHAKVTIGLPYYSDIETLSIDVPMRSGTLQGSKVKIGNVTFRVEQTRDGWIGPDEDNLYDAFTTAIEEKLAEMGEASTALYTGDIRQPLGAGYESGGRVFYRQVSPLPVTINSIVPEVSPGGPSE